MMRHYYIIQSGIKWAKEKAIRFLSWYHRTENIPSNIDGGASDLPRKEPELKEPLFTEGNGERVEPHRLFP